jgi:hypothetical protein
MGNSPCWFSQHANTMHTSALMALLRLSRRNSEGPGARSRQRVGWREAFAPAPGDEQPVDAAGVVPEHAFAPDPPGLTTLAAGSPG